MDYIKQLTDGNFLEYVSESLSERATIILEEISEPEQFYLLELDESEEQIDEGKSAGNLSGLSKHLMKVAVKNGAGQNSDVEIHNAKNAAALNKHVKDALAAGHIPVVQKDGSPAKAAISNKESTYGSRDTFSAHTDAGQKSYKETIYPKPVAYGRGLDRKVHYPSSYQVDKTSYSKGDALTHLTSGIEADDFKAGKVSVKVIKGDAARVAKQKARQANKPETQNVHTGTSKNWDEKGYKTKQVASGSMKDITHAAATKIAQAKVPEGSANSKAMELHNTLGQHIQAGNHKGVKETLNALHSHMQTAGLTSREDKVKEYASALKKIKGNSWSAEYAKKDLARLRNESADDITDEEILLGLFEYASSLEESEDLLEVSKELLGRYVKHAAQDAKHKGAMGGMSQDREVGNELNNKADKRLKYVQKAVDKILKK